MRTAWRLAIILTWLGLLTGCAGTPPPSPFKVPEAEFRRQVKTIAIAPLAARDRELRANTEELMLLLEAKVRGLGYRLLSWEYYRSSLEETIGEEGGVYDAQRGTRDEVKYKRAYQRALKILRERHGADAVLFPGLETTSAEVYRGEATWDGAAEWIGPVTLRGDVWALSLVVVINDMQEKRLFVSRAGIQAGVKSEKGKRVNKTARELLADSSRNKEAVEHALAPLAPRGDGAASATPAQ